MSSVTTLPMLLTTREVSELLKVHPGSLNNDRSAGRGLPFVKIGQRVRYRAEDIAAFLAANLVTVQP